jgi:hypothetical protein
MKSPVFLWREVALELGDWCRVSATKDIETVLRRSNTEGISFLTITLPNFGKDFDEALDLGQVDHTHFVGFRRWRGTPRFLGGFLDQVFDRNTGTMLSDPSLDAIYAIRQLSRLVSKILLDCSDERTKHAYDAYQAIEMELEEASRGWSQVDTRDFNRMAKLLFGRVLGSVDNLVALNELVPKHGPGATADRLLGNQKYRQSLWHWRLEVGGFISTDFLLPNSRYYKNLESVQFVDPEDEKPVRVIAVPKTLKTPRIIAIEPTCMQYTQQALAHPLMATLESSSLLGGMIGFTDQGPNRDLARVGSLDGSLATLDLSEASDRVSNQLVQILTSGYTHLSDAVQSCRSLRADVPGHGIIPLTKFASMGSALCFPIEAMVFLTIVFMGIERAHGTKFHEQTIKSYHGRVRIFGDDIIVPKEYARSVSESLELFGLKVNRHKSFWNGNFRESCGKDYFRGRDVTTVKVRRVLPSKRKDVDRIVSTVSLRNQLYAKGFRRVPQYLDNILGSLLKHYPVVEPSSPILGRHDLDGVSPSGFDRKTHSPTVKGWVVKSRSPRNPLDGEGALLKYFLKQGSLPTADVKHLERSGRPLAVDIKLANGPVR